MADFFVKSSFVKGGDLIGDSSLVSGAQTITPTGIISRQAFGSSSFLGARVISSAGHIPSAEVVGWLTLVVPPIGVYSTNFRVSTKPIRAKSFNASTLIAEQRGTYRGEYTIAERNALTALQPGDTIKNIERDVEEYYTGRSWLTGATHFSSESGKKKARVAPTTAGYRAESGSEDKAFRHYTTQEPSRVQTNNGTVTDLPSITVAWPSATTAGNAAIALLAVNQNAGDAVITGPTDYTLVTSVALTGKLALYVYVKQDILDSEGSVVFTSNVARDMDLIIIEYQGMPPLEQNWMVDVYTTSAAAAIGTAVLVGPTDVEMDIENELVVAVVANKTAATQTAWSADYTQVSNIGSGNATAASKVRLGAYEKVALTPESPTMGLTLSSAQSWVSAIVSFRSFQDENFATDTQGRVYGTGLLVTSDDGLRFGSRSNPDIHMWRVLADRLQLDPGDTLAYGSGSELGGDDVWIGYKYGGALPGLRQSVTNSTLREVNVIGAAWSKPTVAGNLLVFAVAWDEFVAGSNVTGIAGPAGGWTGGGFSNNSGFVGVQVYYRVALGNDANPQVNWTGTRAASCVAIEYTRMNALPFDVQTSNASSAANIKITTGVTAVPAQDVSLGIAFMTNLRTPQKNNQSKPIKGYSLVRQIDGVDKSGSGVNLGVYHKTIRPAAQQDTAVTLNFGTNNVGKLMIFKAAAASTVPTTPNKGWLSRFVNQKGGVSPHLISADYILNDAGEVLELGLGGLTGAAAANSVGGDANEASILGAAAYTIPAEAWTAGMVYKIFIAGRATFGTTSRTITVRTKLGAVTVDTFNYVTKVAGGTDVEWLMEFFLQCRSLGTSGTVEVVRRGFDRIEATGVGSKLNVQVTPSTINTQIANLLDVTAQWSANSGTEFIRADVRTVERIKG